MTARRLLMGVVPLVGVTLAPAASAQETGSGTPYMVWSEVGVDAVPDTKGDPNLRGIQLVGVDLPVNNTWSVAAHGAVRENSSAEVPEKLDVYRLSVAYHASSARITAGRLIRMDTRGVERIDGITLALDRSGPASVRAWGGRAWHVERAPDQSLWVGGLSVDLRPPSATGGRSHRTRYVVGYEARAGKSLTHRLLASAVTSSLTGRMGAVQLEVAPATDRTRFRLETRGALPVGRRGTAEVNARWEGLPPVSVQGAIRSPMEWLAPSGYGIAAAELRYASEDVTISLNGGPTWFPERSGLAAIGGMGRARASVHVGGDASVSTFAAAGGIGASWLAGGGVAGQVALSHLELSGELGAFGFQPLDGLAVPVWEGRMSATTPIAGATARDRIDLSWQVSAGQTRLLAPWVRGGVLLRATLDHRVRAGQ